MEGSVLVVDDEADVRDELETFLREQGYDVHLAINGGDALSKLELFVPDVIVLDIIMPVMDGFSFLEAIRARPTLSSIPILATSSGALFPRTSANVFSLLKPFELADLAAAVKRCIETRRRQSTAT